ncbi:Hemicentin 2 [Desmophyllum pertusum]|uniref:Hemicentin 2 n=1 Tax=Desmophyllum pertusum TaxID=174260 RepID=A0A9X0CJR7_9CNID|nr:Hemicentin 2 [Desmophyllum pertusum]
MLEMECNQTVQQGIGEVKMIMSIITTNHCSRIPTTECFSGLLSTETVYISSNFVEIETKDKPVIKDLLERTTVAVGALAILPCQVNGDPEISVTWSKDGNTSIPRAQFENDGRILAIKDVLPRDSGVYECKASNKFGESRTATILIVAGNMKWLH